MGEKTVRLFVALVLDEGIGAELCALAAPLVGGGVRTYPPRDLHLTLQFIGAVPSARVDALTTALGRELRGLEAPRLRIDSTGCFPPKGRPRVWWAGVNEREGDRRLEALFRAAERALLPPEERAVAELEERTPHLTLGRSPRRGGEGLAELRERFLERPPALEWNPTGVTLVESRPSRPEARYRAVARWPLVAGPAGGGGTR